MKKINRAVITGASSGMGKAFAFELATQGVNLIIVARRTEKLELLAIELSEKFNVTVQTLGLDLSHPASAEALYAFATRDGATVDLLINSAGAGPYRDFLQTPLKEHQKIIHLNLTTLTSLCYLFAEHMIKQNKPSYILNVASIAAFQPVPKFTVYCASKSYVKIFSEILRYELKKTTVSVSCLCPGATKTEFLASNNQISKVGDIILMDPVKVVRIALKGMVLKKSVIIPGLMNKISCFLPRLFPNSVNLWFSSVAMTLSIREKN